MQEPFPAIEVMVPSLTPTESLFDYFKEQVDVATHDTGAPLTRDIGLYLANLLTERARADHDEPLTLAEMHFEALHARPAAQARSYRALGDHALYELGFFKERVARRSVGSRYYADMGSAGYARANDIFKRWFADAFGSLFRDLAIQFEECVSVLGLVRRAHGDGDDIDHMYKEWLTTGSETTARRLRVRGLIIPSSKLDPI